MTKKPTIKQIFLGKDSFKKFWAMQYFILAGILDVTRFILCATLQNFKYVVESGQAVDVMLITACTLSGISVAGSVMSAYVTRNKIPEINKE